MIVLVDTSVWVDHFNGHASAEAASLERYLRGDVEIATCGVVVTELFQGFRSAESVKRLEPTFRSMLWLHPVEPGTYLEAAALFRSLRQRGLTIRSTIDCLIVCIAAEWGAHILSKDRDIRTILDSGLTTGKPAE